MCFVDRDELDRQALQSLAERFIREALGGDVKQLERAGIETLIHLTDLVGIESRVQSRCGNPPSGERIHLVAHQGDQWGNHEREAIEQERRELITKRFPPAGGEHRKGRASIEQSTDDRFLTLTKSVMTEMGAEGRKHKRDFRFFRDEASVGSRLRELSW